MRDINSNIDITINNNFNLTKNFRHFVEKKMSCVNKDKIDLYIICPRKNASNRQGIVWWMNVGTYYVKY